MTPKVRNCFEAAVGLGSEDTARFVAQFEQYKAAGASPEDSARSAAADLLADIAAEAKEIGELIGGMVEDGAKGGTITEAQARQRFKWQDMGTKDGTKTHALFFSDPADNRPMRYGEVSLFSGSTRFQVEGGEPAVTLKLAKAEAERVAIAKLERDGYVGKTPQATAETVPAEPVSQEQSEAPAATGMGRLEVVSVYNTAGGKEAMRIKRLTGSDGRITYSWIGEYGAGSGRPFEAMRDEVALQKRAHRGMVLVSGAEFDSLQPAPTSGPIEDVGEKIGGARKDMAESGGTRSKRGTTDDRPAWARRFEISQIVTPGGMVGEVKDAGRWIIRDARNLDWMKQPRQVGRSTYATKEEAEAQVPLAAVALKHRVVLARSAAPKTEADVDATLKADMAAKAADDERPGKIEYGLMQTARKRLAAGSMTQANFNILQEKYGAAAAQYTPPAEPAVKAPTGEKYEIWRDITDRKRVKVVDQQFDSREEAMAYMMANAVQIVEANTTFGEADLPLPPDRARTGPERRTGNVTADDFKATFGFRGVQFGNWNNQDERQALMNDAWDGLMDLADVLGLPPKALGLNGDLALAFGARGHGLNSARAHYEPARTVINLTKEQGAGSLAHEWFHALDHYFGRQDGKASATWKVGQDGTRTLDVSGDGAEMVSSGFRGERSGVRKGLRNAYDAMLRTMTKKAETYVEDTAKADKWTGVAREELAQALASLRRELAEQKDVRYYKRNNKPASAELLAEVDALSKAMLEGEATALATEWKSIQTNKAKIAHRWTNDSLERLGAIYKEVRGRSGFDSTNRNGTMDRLRGNMERYSQRLKMLAEAQAGTEKTKMVPTEFAMNARELDQGRGTDYWTTPHEMAARAFQGYVEDKVAERGGMSRFLNYGPANVVIITPWGFKRPFPAGTERAAINKAFDAFIGELQTKETDKGVALLSQAPAQPLTKLAASTTGTDPGKLTAMVENIRAGWADAPPVTVVATTNDLPAPIVNQLRSMNAFGSVRALVMPDTGQVYLIADRLPTLADAQFALAHEVLGHYGMRKFLGADYEKTMRQMRAMNAGLAAESRSWMAEYGPGQIEARVKRGMSYAEATVEVDLLSVEEALADRAGKPEQISGFKRLVAKLQAWLREHGFMGAAQWLEGKTQAQVLSLLQSARDAVEKAEGVHAYTEPAAALLSQADQTDTPAFKRWFGDSKVVDAEGKPLVVYHGTRGDFNVFNTQHPDGIQRHYFAADPATAAEYANDHTGRTGEGGNVMPAYLAIRNPAIIEADGSSFAGVQLSGVPAQIIDALPPEAVRRGYSTLSTIARVAESLGHDGLIVRNVRDGAGPYGEQNPGDVYIAFRPEQIKSATGNSGSFDPSNPSILLSQIQQGNIPGTSDTEQAAIAKGYKARVKAALKRADGVINGLGELPDTEQYLGQRYLALGKIAAVDKVAGDIRAAFRKADPDDKKAIYTYLTTADASPDPIADPASRTMAAKVKRYIGTVGDQLVARGLISEESRETYRDAYLPRLYLAHLLSDGDWRAIGTGKKVSDMGYLKARKDIPQEIRDVILGEVKDPAFLAATAIAKPMRDMALLDWLAQISEHKEWVQANSLTEWQGKRVSVFWLKAEADALRTRAVHYPEATNRDKAMAIANAMDATAVKALEGADFNRTDYKQIPNAPKYGRLRGIYVRTEIYNDLMGAQDFMPTDPGFAQKILGYGGIGTKVTQLWKMSKVSLNIPGQVRNAISNGVMLQLSGVPFHSLPLLMARAIRQVRNGGKHWAVAKKYGVTESTFQAQEMFRARRDLLDLERDLKGLTPLIALKTVGAVIADAAGDTYQFTEALFKTVKIMDAMERQGMDEEAAAIEAQKWLFDYSLIDKNVRYLRNAPVGMPFLTYTTKVLPRLAEVALLHPQRFLPWVALMYGMQAWAQAMFGGDDDEWDELKKALPKWMQEKGHVAFLPWRDDAGRLQAVDMSYFFPWSQWAEFGRSLTEGDLKGAGRAMGLFGGPVTSVITAWATGEDSFTGRQIINEGDPTSYQAASLLAYTWDLMMPPMMGSSGVVSPMWLLDPQYGGKLAQASTGATNRMGDQKATYGQAASRIAGFNAYGIDPEVTRTSNLIGMKADIAKARAALRSKLGNQGLTPTQQKKLIEDYTAEMAKRAKEMQKYAEESTVPDFARREKVTE